MVYTCSTITCVRHFSSVSLTLTIKPMTTVRHNKLLLASVWHKNWPGFDMMRSVSRAMFASRSPSTSRWYSDFNFSASLSFNLWKKALKLTFTNMKLTDSLLCIIRLFNVSTRHQSILVGNVQVHACCNTIWNIKRNEQQTVINTAECSTASLIYFENNDQVFDGLYSSSLHQCRRYLHTTHKQYTSFHYITDRKYNTARSVIRNETFKITLIGDVHTFI